MSKPVSPLSRRIRTGHPQPLESHLHDFLASRGKRLTNAIGTEWFDTNPDEVLTLAVDTIWVTAPM
ncbi:GIY-YIG nuclease family protein [Streptomyces sp. Caat 7-52]|uniref:GIY-YIG nuclease family protein n=1 Tax=Streptomyces sp. Caat 7-52 TaxID=2949637 RepID=UPI00203598D3|nr:GIY-YIG nuclease family protein [Streptomyces sp. Caat 7-52]